MSGKKAGKLRTNIVYTKKEQEKQPSMDQGSMNFCTHVVGGIQERRDQPSASVSQVQCREIQNATWTRQRVTCYFHT